MAETKRVETELTREERQIIELVRDIKYGELVVMVKEGVPTRAEIKKSISLKDNI